jgi:hypothetical protein
MKRYVVLLLAGLLAAIPAFSHTLNVPFFADSSGNLNNNGNVSAGSAGFVGIQNTTGNPIVLNIVYVQFDQIGDPQVMAPQQFTVLPGEGLSWRPARDDPSEGLRGQAVPGSDPAFGPFGSIQIIWSGGSAGALSIIGRYVQLSSGNAFSHVLSSLN